MKSRLFDDAIPLPLIIEPEADGLEKQSLSSLIDWLTNDRATFDSELLKHGALLFRGFSIRSADEFEAVTQAIEPRLLSYVEGDSPRTRVKGNIYTSTEYPKEYRISLHNELSFAHKWPRKLFFYCAVPPAAGGETLIADCREVLRALPAEVRQRFAEKKIMYVNNLHGGLGIGKSWQETFETADKAAVESHLRSGGAQFEWKTDGGLWISQVREAVTVHPETGEQVWFNQADQWHASLLDEETREAFLDLDLDERDLPHNSFFGDGSPIDPEDLKRIRSLMFDKAIFFPWQQGDLLVIDNMLTAHGRNSYEGTRRILVAMA